MKKNLVVAIVLLMAAGALTSAKAQENVVKVNIFSPIFKTLNLSYERKISANSSLQLGFLYTFYSPEDASFSGIGLTPEYRFYLSDTEAPAGVYVSPFLRYLKFSAEGTEDGNSNKGTLSIFGGGVTIGKQWIFKEKISLDVFIGPQFLSADYNQTSGQGDLDYGIFDGFGVRAGLTFGFAF